MSHRSRWKYKVTINFKDEIWDVCDWITLDQDGKQWQVLVSRLLNPQILKNVKFFLKTEDQLFFIDTDIPYISQFAR